MTRPGYDAVVVGGGHNGLVCAAYLARGGMRTLVVERRRSVGGAALTGELSPGVRVPTLAHTVGGLRPAIARDLRLREHGLALVQPEVRAFAPCPDGTPTVLYGDPTRTAEGLRARSARDAAAYPEFDRRLTVLARFVRRLMATTPPDLKRPNLGDALAGVQLGLAFRGLGTSDGRELLRVAPMAVGDLVGESLTFDAHRAVVAARGVRYTAMGPWSAGTALALITDSAAGDGGAAGQTAFARGGPGALTDALTRAAHAFGADVRTEAEVISVMHADGRVSGVRLASGEEIRAPVVASGIDPKRTLLGLVGAPALGPSLAWRAGNVRVPGTVAKVNLALARLPAFPGVSNGAEGVLRGRIVIAPGIDALARAHDASKYGRISDEPFLEATIPSIVDPSLVDSANPLRARHVMSILVQYAPFRLRDASWDDQREPLGDLVVQTLERYAAGLGGLVLARQVVTPLDLEREYGLTGGHPLHGEPGLDQMFAWRPLLGHARYRMPLDGLYLCGSGAHPGGGVTGYPGSNAAREILADARRR